MSTRAYRRASATKTPQSRPIRGRNQVKNNAGGFVFKLDKWDQLDRFLVLGIVGGTYYQSEGDIADENFDLLDECIRDDADRVAQKVTELSVAGRTHRQTQLIYALAACAMAGSLTARQNITLVCRTGTHLFQYIELAKSLGKITRAHWKHIAKWYTMDAEKLAYQMVKYKQREGWTHADVLNMAHPYPPSDDHNELYYWATTGEISGRRKKVMKLPVAAEQCYTYEYNTQGKVEHIEKNGLPREALPTDWLQLPEVWECMLPQMPMTALIRNLGKMTSNGLLKSFSSAERVAIDKLTNQEAITKARIHPLSVLIAQKVYKQGHGHLGSLRWDPSQGIREALDETYELAFGNLSKVEGNTYLAVDCSGSMSWEVPNSPLTCREAAAAMALIQSRCGNTVCYGFAHGASSRGYRGWDRSNIGMAEIPMTRRMGIDALGDKMARIDWGATDCSLPMRHAMQLGLEVDNFVVYTDNETWYGDIHPCQALEQYRQKMGRDAKLIVVAFTSTGFSIADPEDPRTLDVVGFDSAVPRIISDFVSGDLFA